MDKVVFIIFYQSAVIESKIKRVCDAFGARRYTIPDVAEDEGVALAGAMRANLRELVGVIITVVIIVIIITIINTITIIITTIVAQG